jgi:hypothetical protein
MLQLFKALSILLSSSPPNAEPVFSVESCAKEGAGDAKKPEKTKNNIAKDVKNFFIEKPSDFIISPIQKREFYSCVNLRILTARS